MRSAIKITKHLIDIGNAESIKDLTPLKVMKLTYLAHGWMLGMFGEPIFGEDVEAWKYGPVIPEVYREIKVYDRQHINSLSDMYKIDDISPKEEHIMDEVIRIYGAFTGLELVNITHAKDTPWDKATDGGKNIRSGIIISNEVTKAYYANLL